MKTYLASYQHNGSRWSFEFYAENDNDAKNRLEQIKEFSVLDGELIMKIPALSGFFKSAIARILDVFCNAINFKRN